MEQQEIDIWLLIGIIITIIVVFTLLKIAKVIKGQEITFASYSGGRMTVIRRNGKKEKYKGDCTVWYKLPSYEICDTFTDSELSQIQKYIENENKPYTRK